MNPEKEYSMISSIFINKKSSSKLWVVVKAVLIFYIAVALFKTLMDGKLDVGAVLGNIIMPLIILAGAFQGSKAGGGYEKVGLTLRFFREKLQVVYGAKDYHDGCGVRVKVYEILYSDIQQMEYSMSLICIRLAGKYRLKEYKDETLADTGMCLAEQDMQHELYVYPERERAEEIVTDLSEFSGINVNYRK